MIKRRIKIIFAVGFFLLLLSSLAGIFLGAAKLSPAQLLADIFQSGLSKSERILLYVRLPRVLGTILAGAALAVSGAIIQAVLGNPIAAPNIIGVNAGAGFFTVLCLAAFPNFLNILPAAAFIGAFAAVMLVYGIAKKTGASKMTLVLSGVAVSSLMNAASDTVITLFPDVLTGFSSFRAGSVSGLSLAKIFPAWIYIWVGIIAAFLLSHDLDILSLGDKTAQSLGMNVSLMRFIFLAAAALLAGAAVSFSGLIGFVGLVVPHIVRRLSGTSENRIIIPLCAIFGGTFVNVCDIASRTFFAPYELPLGICISYIGAPFFIYLLIRKKGGKHGD
ncbi:MAG: iron ABC transporter permease [Oscillospiraceae bacterium]|nr:iron ABC transporter permease [Oscillospiraceae bacterium]